MPVRLVLPTCAICWGVAERLISYCGLFYFGIYRPALSFHNANFILTLISDEVGCGGFTTKIENGSITAAPKCWSGKLAGVRSKSTYQFEASDRWQPWPSSAKCFVDLCSHTLSNLALRRRLTQMFVISLLRSWVRFGNIPSLWPGRLLYGIVPALSVQSEILRLNLHRVNSYRDRVTHDATTTL